MMAWWKGTPDDDGNWEKDIAELRQLLMDTDPEFARREKDVQKLWAKAALKAFEKESAFMRMAIGGIVKIKD